MSESFYNYFVNNIIIPQHNNDDHKLLKDQGFRRFLIDKYGLCFDLIKTFSIGLINLVQKPQRCFEDTLDYYVACDLYTRRLYMCFRNIMMIDIDYGKNNQFKDKNEALKSLGLFAKQHNICFSIYFSANGIHAFAVDKKRSFKDKESIELMLKAQCDMFYAVYSYIRGWSVRLNKKEEESLDTPIYIKYGLIGDKKYLNKSLLKLVDKHFELSLLGDRLFELN